MKLYWSSQGNISLKEAIDLQKFNLENAIGLFYSPNWCKFGKLEEDGTVKKSKENNTAKNHDDTLDLQSVFEARIFNEECEMRWLNFSAGKGKAVLLSEAKESFGGFAELLEPINFLEIVKQTYLLWGEGTDKEINAGWSRSYLLWGQGKGWSRLATARIGKLDVPIEGITRTQGVQLVSKEYLGEIDDFGNVAVVEERLIKLKSIQRKK